MERESSLLCSGSGSRATMTEPTAPKAFSLQLLGSLFGVSALVDRRDDER